MAQSDYSWSLNGDGLNFKFDISNLGLDSANLYTGGMGIRINNTSKKISKVFIDNTEHFAFNDNLVILPNIAGSSADIKIILADETSVEPHLIYISKRMTQIDTSNDELALNVLTKSKAKFTFNAPGGYLLLNADGFNYGSKNPNELNGYVNTDRTVKLKKLNSKKIFILNSTITISDITEKENTVILKLKGSGTDSYQMQFKSKEGINKILLDSDELNITYKDNKYIINIDPFEGEKDLSIKLK